MDQLEASKAAQRDLYKALAARKQALAETLRKRTEELKTICIQEAELTGKLPPETPLAPNEPMPQIRRRVGTTFTLSPKVMNKSRNEVREIFSHHLVTPTSQ